MDILGVMVLSVATAVGGGTGPRFIDRPDARFLAEAAQIVWIAVFVGAAIFALGMLAGSAGGIVRDILGQGDPCHSCRRRALCHRLSLAGWYPPFHGSRHRCFPIIPPRENELPAIRGEFEPRFYG